MRSRVVFYFTILFGIFWLRVAYAAADKQEFWVPVAIHMSTAVSDGELTLSEVISEARAKGMKAVIVTDRDFMKWEYGLWPLRNIIKRTKEMNSVFKYGVDKYLNLVESEAKRNPDIVIIPGVESAPFYYWQGVPFTENFKICDWHKHMLVFGLEKPQDLKRLPVLSNKKSLRRPFRKKDIFRLWPFLTFVFGFIFLRVREFSYKDSGGHELGRFSRSWRATGFIVMVLSLFFIFNDNPFFPLEYDQYSINAGINPYQTLIDYVNQRGGMTFWAHPEAENLEEQGGVKIETREHTADLLEATDYTGFAIFYEGYKKVGKIGGIWDLLLREYCEGRRRNPVWAIAGLAFDSGTAADLGKLMDDVQTYVLTQEISPKAILEAMHHGKMYASISQKKDPLYLEEFFVKDLGSDRLAAMGGEVWIEGKPVIVIKGKVLRGASDVPVEIKLIRDGKVLEIFRTAAPFDITYEDNSFSVQKTFYRLEINYRSQIIVSNPIFAVKKI